jgi:hypothetical protein
MTTGKIGRRLSGGAALRPGFLDSAGGSRRKGFWLAGCAWLY